MGEVVRHEPLLRKEMPELDTIRGLAILGVIVYHAFYWSRDLSHFSPLQRIVLRAAAPGEFGVSLFFVLSGFLITGLLLDSRDRPDYYRRFYFRRALRILPAYYGILIVLLVAREMSRSYLIMSLLYCSNLSLLFGIQMTYPVLWSLSVEEHFYLVWPAVVRRVAPRGLIVLAGAIILFTPLLRLACFYHGLPTHFSNSGCDYYTWNMADGLACGSVLSLLLRRMNGDRKKFGWLCLGSFIVAGFLSVVALPFGLRTGMRPVGAALQWTISNVTFMGILALFLLVGTSRWKALVTSKVLRFFGYISYGLYLVHLLVYRLFDDLVRSVSPVYATRLFTWDGIWLRFLIAGGAAVLLSYLSRRFFEEAFLRLKSKIPPPVPVATPL